MFAFSLTQAQAPVAAEQQSEMLRLVHAYRSATEEYKLNLGRLAASYQKSVTRAEAELARSKEMFDQNLISEQGVASAEKSLVDAKRSLSDVNSRIAAADSDLAKIPTDDEILRQERKLDRQYRRAITSQPSCRNWTLFASRTQTPRGFDVKIRLSCYHY